MIARLIESLRQVGLEPTAREVAEMLFLAMHLPGPGAAARTAAEQLAGAAQPAAGAITDSGPSVGADPARQKGAPPPTDKAGPQPGDLYLPSAGQTSSNAAGVSAMPFRAAAASALPRANQVARALRPLRRRHLSRRRLVIDEEKTVQLICDGGPRTVVLRPAPVRWLEVALVIDEGASMRVWRPTVGAFQRLLERHGSFRDVRAWGLDADDGALHLYREVGLSEEARRLRHPDELLDPEGRRLIIVVSDCVSAGWRNGTAFRLLARWGRRGPVALAQVLPQRLWLGTALGQLDAGLCAPAPGVPNHKLQAEPSWLQSEPLAKGVALPVVTLEEWSLTPWARLVAGAGGAYATGLIIPDDAGDEEEQAVEDNQAELQATATPSSEALVRNFRAVASPEAYQLACYLAAVPLSFPVMRLVQQAMLPNSTQTHLAEFFLSGLLRQVTPADQTVRHPDEILYEFRDAVRPLLLSALLRRDKLRVLSETSSFLESRLAYSGGFAALAAGPGINSASIIDQTSLAFAHLGAQILRQLGGYDESVARLEQVVREVAPEAGTQSVDMRRGTAGVQPETEAKFEPSETAQPPVGSRPTDQVVSLPENNLAAGFRDLDVSQQRNNGYRYACYISYKHNAIENEFVDRLYNALSRELEAYTERRIYFDKSDLVIGELWEPQVTEALYYSACMIAVMTPTYFNSSYCLRELKAIEQLEAWRRPMQRDQSQGLVIPVLLRGKGVETPVFIRDRQYVDFSVDFSEYSSGHSRFLSERRFFPKIGEIVRFIVDRCRQFDDLPQAFDNIKDFRLPSEEQVASWRQLASQPSFPTVTDLAAHPRRVFVSSTVHDLAAYRRVISSVIDSHGLVEAAMEFPSTEETALFDKSFAEIAACDLFIGVYAWRIGFIPERNNPQQLSLTELEYREAKRLGKPCLIFLAREGAPWPRHLEDHHNDRIINFRAQLQSTQLVAYFTTPSDLEGQVEMSLRQWEESGDVVKSREDVLSGLEAAFLTPSETDEPGREINETILSSGLKNVYRARLGGTIRYDNLNTVVNSEGEIVAMNRHGSLLVVDDRGLEVDRFPLTYGTTILCRDSQRVEEGQKLAEWDPHTDLIITEVGGIVHWRNLIEGVTVHEVVDEVTGLTNFIVIDSPDEIRYPRIEIRTDAGKVLKSYTMPISANLMVGTNDEVAPGDTIAKIPHEIIRTEEDILNEKAALENMGRLYVQNGEIEQAIDSYERALAIAREADDLTDALRLIGALGHAYQGIKRQQRALSQLQRTLSASEQSGNELDAALSQFQIAVVLQTSGDLQQALSWYQRALGTFERLGRREGMADTLLQISLLHLNRHRYREAIEANERLLSVARSIGSREREADALNNLGYAYVAYYKKISGSDREWRRAVEFCEQALAIYRELGDGHKEAVALRNLANAWEHILELPRAIEQLEQARNVLRSLGDEVGEADTLYQLSKWLNRLGNRTQTISYAEAALKIFEKHDSQRAGEVRAQLAGWRKADKSKKNRGQQKSAPLASKAISAKKKSPTARRSDSTRNRSSKVANRSSKVANRSSKTAKRSSKNVKRK